MRNHPHTLSAVDEEEAPISSGSFTTAQAPHENDAIDELDMSIAAEEDTSIDETFASRTSKIMSDYQSYLSRINQDLTTGDVMASGRYRDDTDASNSAPNALQCKWRDNTENDLDEGDGDFEHGLSHVVVQRDRKYTYPVFHSKKFKQGAMAIVLACVVIGTVASISNGIEKSNRIEDLPDWETELQEQLQQLSDKKEHRGENLNVISVSTTQELEQTVEVAYKTVSEKYHPRWFNRARGWVGQTYDEGVEFCNAKNEGHVPCPFEAICPLGKDSMPLGGYKEGALAQWVPINDANEWVKVSGTNGKSCETSVILALGDAEEMTNHIACCLSLDSSSTMSKDTQAAIATSTTAEVASEETENLSTISDEDVAVYTATKQKYNVHWFNRGHGWAGQTYDEGVEFCSSEKAGHVPCPFQAICPLGKDSMPLGGYRAGTHAQWVPVNDDINEWAKISGNHGQSCVTHIDPEALAGDNAKSMTNHIACCLALDSSTTTGKGTEEPIIETTSATTAAQVTSVSLVEKSNGGTSIKNPSKVDEQIVDLEALIEKGLQPIWLDISHGWKGESHDDAISFCETLGQHNLCPYEAYCPHGPGQPVFGGHTTDFNTEGEQWAPIYGKANGWIMISQKKGNSATTCLGHEELEGSTPEWGLSGDKAWKKKHIMCCVVQVQ